MQIDWDWLVEGYNNAYNTTYKDEQSMLRSIGPALSPRKLALQLGVAYTTIYYRLDKHQIPRSHVRGGPNHKGGKEQSLLSIPPDEMRELTVPQIAIKIGIHKDYCYQLVRKNHRKFKSATSPTQAPCDE